MEGIVALFIPIAICVVLPIMVVWLNSRVKINEENRKTEILMQALKSNPNVDPEQFMEALKGKKGNETPLQLFRKRLLKGCIFSLTGIVMLSCGFIFDNLNLLNMIDMDSTANIVLGGILISIGISYLTVCWVSRKDANETADCQ